MKPWRYILAGFLCLLITAPASASITGTITDTNGYPVSGADVVFTDTSNPDIQFSDITDKNGKYEVDPIIVGVYDSTPSAFSLGQNYPNPFNPTTTIPFTLEKSSHVSLSIYNITGQQIEELASGEMAAGHHTITWNGMDLNGSSVGAGIYFYRLQAGDYIETKKMLLLDGGGGSTGGMLNANTGGIVRSAGKIAENVTYTVTISHTGFMLHDEVGVVPVEDEVRDFTVELPNGSKTIGGIMFVYIPGGTFRMGDLRDSDQRIYELPVHTVTVSPFYMSMCEITQKQFETVKGYNPSRYYQDEDYGRGDNYPVYYPSWFTAIGYCNNLSDATYLNKCYNNLHIGVNADFSKNGFRLPSEAEWEYACRAVTETLFSFGSDVSEDGETSADLAKTDWYKDNSGYKTHPVGQKTANAFGLYDMHGNVAEWCNDVRGDYSAEDQTDPIGPEWNSGENRVVHGGSFVHTAIFCRSSFRGQLPVFEGHMIWGFRIVCRPAE